MDNDTVELLRLVMVHLRPRLQGRDEEWQELEHLQRELGERLRHRCSGDAEALSELIDLEDAWAGAAERASSAYFFLGLQMGLELGRINYLREE